MAKRILFDISTSMRWSGPPVGIVRVERELARWASRHHANCRFGFFDADSQAYRQVLSEHLPAILDDAVMVDTTGMSDVSQTRRRRSDRVPRSLRTPFLWLTQFRRMALRSAGGWLLKGRSPAIEATIARLQLMIAGKKYRGMLMSPGGGRRLIVSLAALTGALMQLDSDDVVLFAGSNWAHSNAGAIGDWQKRIGVGLISLCHDIIPLLLPEYFRPNDVELLRRHFDRVFAIASLNLVASKVVGADIRKYCAGRGIAAGPVMQIPFGFDLPKGHAGSPNAPPNSRYIMLVSTIEPRKGHCLIEAVWNRLLQERIPQELDLSLLLIGRSGWLVEDLIERLRETDRVLLMEDVDDASLGRLYDQASFCIYPSEYEGYGLPVVEALARGKPVLASDVGIVPELRSSLLKRLPPRDEEAWYQAIRTWLLNLDSVPRADGTFRHPTWDEAAAAVFKTIDEFISLEAPNR
ncbi:glycosyltransferase [Rhodoplanes sp. Z2-YC6860]|uniref:glycosyltransferase n=1 Tax=Rhodoplanes sp. Z2-YC6860 TaxID=674703 RepID=UPI00078D12B6|nr:glycosyltransferase [Rhodoplanes sp. Z2-YC6860]AMN39121.1 glycosyltransferase WbpX [Rhodoplanes sp. Z2-YC6860]